MEAKVRDVFTTDIDMMETEVVKKTSPVSINETILAIPSTESSVKGILPDGLPERDLQFIYMLSKEMIIGRLTEKHADNLMEKDREISMLNKKLHKKTYIDPKYATTKDAAAYIGTDPSFLTKRQGKTFVLGKHFFKPNGESIVRWDLEALDEWLISEEAQIPHIDEKLASLLERS